MSDPALQKPSMSEEKPPLGSSWRQLYTAVLLFLALQIALFYAFTRAFQ
ncbi:MAG TPA: hypothetical protein VFL80_11445 [Thermoanaerobaculia bacterium]|nr:hypothetical protein [Thermoanaerobaculia bacterium]